MKYIVNDITYAINVEAVAVYITTLVLFLLSVYYVVV